MSQHKLTKEETFHIQTQEEIKRWEKVYSILEDFETRLKLIETKTK
jgi:hypothetical protein|tara:strand:- start:4832 stop:4969 length:138 start_codon:yes stop_codon:yes gene_type:complete